MIRYIDSTFARTTVLLDGSHFSGCTFNDCTLVFRGQAPMGLERCTFIQVRWAFEGPAALTMGLLAGLWRDGGREVVEAMLGGAPGPAPSPHGGN